MCLSGMRLTASDCKYNMRVKYYPNEAEPCQILIAEEPIFNPDRVEDSNKIESMIFASRKDRDADQNGDSDSENSAESEKGSCRGSRDGWLRAKRRAYDFIRSTPELNVFLTLTLDGDQIDRSSWSEVIKKLSVWLDNRVRRKGLIYILCPEYHGDGKSIHFHGLANFDALDLVEARSPHTGRLIKNKGKQVYNVDDFPFGFSTAIPITGEEANKACAGYIFKYMSKQGNNRIGGRYYLAGGDLKKPLYLFGRCDFDAVDAYKFALRGVSGGMKVLTGDDIKAMYDVKKSP